MHSSVLTFVFLLFFSNCDGKSYKDHSLIHVVPSTDDELDFFKELEGFYNVTFWRKPSLTNRSIEFSISRLNLAELIRDTKDMNIEFLTVIRDLQSAFDNQTIRPYIRRKMETFDWHDFYSVEDIYNWLRDLRTANPTEVVIQSIGRSVQNRHLLAVKVKLDRSNTKPKVIIEGGCHAREWLSPAFVTFMINSILKAKTSTNVELKTIAYAYEWLFIPLLNPDGYAYSQTTDRLWRTNFHGDYGVDLNRNFGIHFGKFGCGKSIHDVEYCGPYAFSEPESKALAAFTRDNSNNLKYYISIHSYGQYLIVPYAFANEHLDNYYEVETMAYKILARSIKKHGHRYHIGTAMDTVGYKASGTTSDWIKKAVNIPYVLTIELPDTGEHGFALPPALILPTCEATMDSILPFLDPQNEKTDKLRDRETMDSGYKRNKDFIAVYICYALCLLLIG